MHFVFVYGTLLDPSVQSNLFGKVLEDQEDALLHDWKICTDWEYPYIKPKTGSKVTGKILKLSKKQLLQADRWEEVPDVYQRIKLLVVQSSGKTMEVWVYIR